MEKEELNVQEEETKETQEAETPETETSEKETEETKTFTQEELDRIIQDRLDRHEKKLKEQQAEAEKLKKMNAEQKAQYEREQQEARIQELEAEVNRHEMEKVASGILSENGISSDEAILAMVTRDTAEETQKCVDAFIKAVDNSAEAKIKEQYSKPTPKAIPESADQTNRHETRKDQFDKVNIIKNQ